MKNKVLYFLLFIQAIGSAQIYNFKHYTEDQGLAQSFIYDVIQDKNGNIVVGTGDGLSKFNGTRFINYTSRNGLAENIVSCLYEDSIGNLFAGHFQEGLSIIEPNSKVTKVKLPNNGTFKIKQILQIHSTKYAIITNGGGIFIFDRVTKEIKSFSENLLNFTQIEIKESTLYLLQADGIYTCSVSDFVNHNEKSLKKIIELSNGIKFLLDENEITVVDQEKGLIFYELKEAKVINTYNSFFTNSDISDICVSTNGSIWITSNDKSAYKLETEDKWNYHTFSFGSNQGLLSDNITSVFSDREGNMWFGTYGSGLYHLTNELLSFYSLHTEDGKNHLAFDMEGLKDSSMVIACDNGLFLFRDNSIQKIPAFEKQMFNLLSSYNQALFAATQNGKIFNVDIKKKKSKEILAGLLPPGTKINFLSVFNDELFVCASTGLLRYHLLTGKIQVYSTENYLLHNNVNHAFVDSRDRLWISSDGSPIYYIDNNNQRKVFDKVEGIHYYKFNGACEDKNGNIWISSAGDGVFLFNGNSFRHYSMDNGLLSNYCYGVISDYYGTTWVIHLNGLSIKSQGRYDFTNVTRSPLMPEFTYLENAFYYDLNHKEIFFGTSTGISKIKSKENHMNELSPVLSFEKITFNNLKLDHYNDTTFKYSGYDVSINFNGICMTDPRLLEYKYMLEGLDDDWHPLHFETRKVFYPKLKDGTYTFKLIARNNDGIWSKTPLTYSFTIAAPFWKKVWFYVVLVIASGLGIRYFIIWRTKALLQRQRELELIVTNKTLEIKREKNKIEGLFKELEVKNKDITDSINYAQRIQFSLLPKIDKMKEDINCSVFYQPKDVVSGDFYWYHKTDSHIYIAAVDCTGHGVPGAFMSIIGSSALNDIVKNNLDFTPSQILENLDRLIVNMLQQSAEGITGNRDGMDVALCKVHLHSGFVEFAGAARPIYLIHKGELIKYKGSPFSIGGVHTEFVKKFENHYWDYDENDNFFIFSDGFADQYGGPELKKYSTKRLGEFMLKLSQAPVIIHSALIKEEFDEWKDSEDQTDDVLVISFKAGINK
jgi:serine phosphatase RsbU (regulator of sigma subunit)/ligand-binding sensor domain-containing protein